MNYYNEFDPKAAAWLEELIKEGLIPNGKVDRRSIRDVCPGDLEGFVQCHFFAGIGGWPYALRLSGWPDNQPVWTGSCPCQPFSCAGKGLGTADERHLWPTFRDLIAACHPPTVFGEQVASKAGRDWLAGVFADLEGLAYQRAGADLCAAGIGAPHIRQRLYWCAFRRLGEPAVDGCEVRSQLHRELRRQGLGEGCESGPLAHPQHDAGRADEPGRGPERRAADGRDCEAGGMANSELRRPEQCDPGQWAVQQPDEDGADGRLEHPSRNGRGERRAEPGQRGAECGCEQGGVGNSKQSGLEGHAGNGDKGNEPGRNGAQSIRPVAATSEPGGLAKSHPEHGDGAGLGASHDGGQLRSKEKLQGFWDNSIWHPCRDGKARRIPRAQSGVLGLVDGLPAGVEFGWLESGFPLAPKIEGRVALLRGYGNAINPILAAEFIQAAVEAISEQ